MEYEFFVLEFDMPLSIEKLSIALPPEMVAMVKGAVEAGEYASSSEVMREALRDWSHKRQLQRSGLEELRQVWQDARAKAGLYVAADEVMDRLERKYQAIADAAGKSS